MIVEGCPMEKLHFLFRSSGEKAQGATSFLDLLLPKKMQKIQDKSSGKRSLTIFSEALLPRFS